MYDLTPAEREQNQAIVDAYAAFGRQVAHALGPGVRAFGRLVRRVQATDRRRDAEHATGPTLFGPEWHRQQAAAERAWLNEYARLQDDLAATYPPATPGQMAAAVARTGS